MNIRFWGVRGSIATPLTNADLSDKLETALQAALKAGLTSDHQIPDFVRSLPWHIRQTAGGDTSCVEIQAGDTLMILDGGTGIRRLGLDLMHSYMGKIIEAHILLTHTHWDHISGIPFFVPGFNPNNRLILYGPFPGLEKRIRGQQVPEYFPVPLPPAFQFVQLKEKDHFQIGEVRVETFPLNHPGSSHAYRITYKNKTVIYATDSEYKDVSAKALKPFTDFFHNADLLIYDAQFTLVENIEKEDWGHSNIFYGIDIALESNVKKLIFTHHDPAYNDKKLWEILQKAVEYLNLNDPESNLQVFLAYEGLTLTV